jgi:hypothetical protein
MIEELKEAISISSRIRSRVISECQITKQTFLNWVNEKTPVPFWAEEKIHKIIEQELGKYEK